MKIGIGSDTITPQFADEREAVRQYAKFGFETLDYSGYRHDGENSIYLRPDWEGLCEILTRNGGFLRHYFFAGTCAYDGGAWERSC